MINKYLPHKDYQLSMDKLTTSVITHRAHFRCNVRLSMGEPEKLRKEIATAIIAAPPPTGATPVAPTTTLAPETRGATTIAPAIIVEPMTTGVITIAPEATLAPATVGD